MRKIKTQAEVSRKKKRDQIIVGVVMTFLLVVSTLGYSLVRNGDEESPSIEDYGFEFFKMDGLWKAEIGDGVFGFQNLPSQVSDINVNISVSINDYYSKPLYLVSPNAGVTEILNNIGGYSERYQEACIDEEYCNGNLPLKDCSNNIIIFLDKNETSVYQNESCIYIVGDGVIGADAFLYDVLGVIQ